MKNIAEKIINIGIPIATGILGIVISLIDLFGNDNIWGVFKSSETLTLLIVGFVAVSIGLERIAQLGKIENKLNEIEVEIKTNEQKANTFWEKQADRIINSLHGVEVYSFDSDDKLYSYIANRLLNVKSTIDDITMGRTDPRLSSKAKEAFTQYRNSINKIIDKKNITYREIFSFPNVEIDTLKELKLTSEKLENYHFKYYISNSIHARHVMQFIILDKTEIVIAYFRYPDIPAGKPPHLAIKNRDIINLFIDYYDMLWADAIEPLKSNNINDIISDIETKY